MPQDRKTLTNIEQTGDTRAKVPLVCIEECFEHIAIGMKSLFPCYMLKKNGRGKEVSSNPLPYKRYEITFFKRLIGVTTCNIVGTLFW